MGSFVILFSIPVYFPIGAGYQVQKCLLDSHSTVTELHPAAPGLGDNTHSEISVKVLEPRLQLFDLTLSKCSGLQTLIWEKNVLKVRYCDASNE